MLERRRATQLQHRVGQGIVTGDDARPVRGDRPAVRRTSLGAHRRPSRSRSPAPSARRGPTTTARPRTAGDGLPACARPACIGGGTTEMARNVISERVLGMPRERSVDRDVAFREVPRGPSATR